MTPKEKAIDLSNKYFEQFLAFGEYLSIARANKCALIAVEHIIDSNPYKIVLEGKFKTESNRYDVAYWEQVKKEINNL